MKTRFQLYLLPFAALLFAFLPLNAAATTYYVDINSPSPTPPYTSWATASTDIQSAVNQTTNGDLVLVNPGTYQSSGYPAPDGTLTAVLVPNSVTLQSMGGASATFINGGNVMRGIYLQNTSILVGFTITNCTAGTNSGGGIYCANNGQTVSNCVIVGNSSYGVGPSDNGTGPGAGGVYNGTLYNCQIISNSAPNGNGGGAQYSILINCLLTGNGAEVGGGIYGGQLYNCIVVANNGSAGYGGGVADGNVVNSIIYDNNANWFGGSYTYCCTQLLPNGNGNITNAPLFVNEAGGDFRLQSNSPCIDTGYNPEVTTTYDLDGNPRIVNGIVDMGAYEYQNTNLPILAIAIGYTNVATGYPWQLQAVFNVGLPTTSLWNFGDGTLLTNQDSVEHIWTSPGVYTVTLTASNNFITSNATASVIIWVSSDVAYVNVNGKTPAPPYSSWNTAATSIQSAISAAIPGGLILVSNGVYNAGNVKSSDGGTNRVVTSQPVIIQSFNGPTGTIIDGGNQFRCIDLTNGAILNGFTLTNGNTANGGGVYCTSTNCFVLNCTIINNNISYLPYNASAVYSGTVSNSTIIRNQVIGDVYSTLYNCVISSNAYGVEYAILNNCLVSTNAGGGVSYSTLYNCIISNNAASGISVCHATGCKLLNNRFASDSAGGGANNSFLTNCLLSGNYCEAGGGASGSTLVNCLVVSNNANAGGGADDSTLINCAIADNTANLGGGVDYCGLQNCILYYNTNFNSPPNSGNYFDPQSINYCCTFPLPGSGHGNFTNAPMFVNLTNDFHLQSTSPCINSGNNAYTTAATDLDGNPRIAGGTVDIGAYEYQTPTSIISYAWLQQYGLPIDGSVDYLDMDGTGMKNWQKWIAGLNPTNPASILAMQTPVSTNSTSGVVVTWQSVSGIPYFLQRSTNLMSQPPFATIQTNIIGQTNTTSYTDTTATNNTGYFYRVGVLAP